MHDFAQSCIGLDLSNLFHFFAVQVPGHICAVKNTSLKHCRNNDVFFRVKNMIELNSIVITMQFLLYENEIHDMSTNCAFKIAQKKIAL